MPRMLIVAAAAAAAAAGGGCGCAERVVAAKTGSRTRAEVRVFCCVRSCCGPTRNADCEVIGARG